MAWPVTTFIAAIRETVPCRTYPDSRRSRCPGRARRIACTGSPDDWEFATYQASTETCQEPVLPGGSPAGTPQEALDCACGLYLADPSAWTWAWTWTWTWT